MNNTSKLSKKIFKKVTAAALSIAAALCPLCAYASVLGNAQINGYTVPIGNGTYFTHAAFYSDQKGVGQQTENYITYSPGSDVIPSITNGAALYGSTTISKETSRLEAAGFDVLGGANADYFSFQTGVPMSNAISDGKILTKDASGQDAIGILPDGSAFISYFTLTSVLRREDGSETNIYNINKYRQPYAIYMMTSDFSSETRNTTHGIDVILGSVEGEMKIGTTMTAVVESVTESSSSVPIPEGKIMITVDANAPAEFRDPIASLAVGEKVSLIFNVLGDERWYNVKTGMGSVGGRLLTNGEINPNLAAGAAPRTAIGVKEDGSIILYTIDGRQSGYSYGVQLKTLAARMKELGCTDALNLDGGGSTSIVAQMPGDSFAALMNIPSEGRERNVSTFFYFINQAKKMGTAANLHIYPLMNYVLKGASLQLMVNATDSGFYPCDVPSDVTFSVEDGKNSSITPAGLFTANDSGAVTVYAKSGDITASIPIICLDSPTEIRISDSRSGAAVKSLTLNVGESVPMSAEAYGGFNRFISVPESYTWTADESIGSFGSNETYSKVFTASENYGAAGNIYISAGSTTVTIPVKINPADFSDPSVYPTVEMSFDAGILRGRVISSSGKVAKDGITLRVDGKKYDFEYNAETYEFTAELPPDAKKITVYATNELGISNCGMLYTGTAGDIQNPFTDTRGHWAESILSYMYDKKIVSGENIDGELHFNPQKQMTRSEFAVMICNFLGADTSAYANVNLPYSDLSSIPAWALNSFKTLYSMGIVKGRYVSETESCADPLSPITRAEASTIIARTLPKGFYRISINVSDKADIPAWAEDGINVLMKLGAINGYSDGRLLPLGKMTKAEAAKILYSIL